MASQAVVAGLTAAAVVVAVGTTAAAGMVAVAEPGATMVAPGAAVEAAVAVVDAMAKTATSPLASPAAAGVVAAVAEPGSYSPPDSAIFWRFGAGSPTKDPSPRQSLRGLSSSWSRLLCEVANSGTSSSLRIGMGRTLSSSRSRLLREVAASGTSSPLRIGTEHTLYLWQSSSTSSFPAGAGPPWHDPPGLRSARCWLSGEVLGIRIP
jgi:hypothetical protein